MLRHVIRDNSTITLPTLYNDNPTRIAYRKESLYNKTTIKYAETWGAYASKLRGCVVSHRPMYLIQLMLA